MREKESDKIENDVVENDINSIFVNNEDASLNEDTRARKLNGICLRTTMLIENIEKNLKEVIGEDDDSIRFKIKGVKDINAINLRDAKEGDKLTEHDFAHDYNSLGIVLQKLYIEVLDMTNGHLPLIDDPKDKNYGKPDPLYYACRSTIEQIQNFITDENKALIKNPLFEKEAGISNVLLREIKGCLDAYNKVENGYVKECIEKLSKEKNTDLRDKLMGNIETIYNQRGESEKKIDDYIIIHMSENESFCRYRIDKAQRYINKCAESRGERAEFNDPEKVIDALQKCQEEILIGERFLSEMNNVKIAEGNYDENVKDMCVPVPHFAMKEAENNYAEAEAADKEYEERKNFILAFATDIKKAAPYPYHITEDDEKTFAQKLVKHLSKDALHPKGTDKLTEDLHKLLSAGCDLTLAVGSENMKALSGTGTDEYTAMHKAYAAYLTKARQPGVNCKAEINNVFTEAREYLLRKDSTPWTPSGKDRVEAAAKIFTRAAIKMLKDADAEMGASILTDLKTEMVRNQTCREIVKEYILKKYDEISENAFFAQAFDFAMKCDKVVEKNQPKNGVIFAGKIIPGNDQAVNDQIKQNITNAVAQVDNVENGLINNQVILDDLIYIYKNEHDVEKEFKVPQIEEPVRTMSGPGLIK